MLIVENGTGLPDAESYVSVAEACAYHLARRNDAWLDPEVPDEFREAALVRATAFIDATYRDRFPGYRVQGRVQALEWPRVSAFTLVPDNGRSAAFLPGQDPLFRSGVDAIPSTEIPREVVAAVCEAALRELTEPGSLSPDLERGGAIKRLAAGSVEIEYAGGAPASTTFQAIGLALASLLLPANPYSGRAVRG
ncbi:DnaT-like ssDNA-binding protein [Methylobacterium isbiliense]|jgi:hypothetical protein|uniref:Putative DnaT-like domain-containing protein n=1 Tax=Methylobacterium isbiliense TaxID=315478 RepID=A0ABQ4SDT1_9HYPH|nr:DnaT-like ssDNA-binding protein [Methylobacterium isbiliense]MDN3622595.1 hypothetical protein [Methylobacterium isbiliense]GJE00556.1 hypothetical protein GMJLKIPL_2479 [Methylobacterium isbiliense]